MDLFDEIRKLKRNIETSIPPSRERSLVVTKLDEARHWLMEAIEPGPCN